MTVRNFGNNVNEYYIQLTRKNFNDRAARLAEITTQKAAEDYVADVKKKMETICNSTTQV